MRTGSFVETLDVISYQMLKLLLIVSIFQGRIQDFKLGGAHLKKLRRAVGGAKLFWVFRVKNHDFTPKNHFFSILGGGGGGGARCTPSGSAPVFVYFHIPLG
jgi:hypothetical protein